MLAHRTVAVVLLALSALVVPPSHMPANAAELSPEMATGAIAFAANASIILESQEVVITQDRITVTYGLRNNASMPQSLLLTFAMPDLDVAAIADKETAAEKFEQHNFIGAATQVDGQPVTMLFEQRALALGLDVTASLKAARLPLVSAAGTFSQKLAALEPGLRLDLLERGILKEDGPAIVPAWTVKSVGYWRQTFSPGPATIVHTYQPIAGSGDYHADLLPVLRKRHCLTAAQEGAIAALSLRRSAAQLTSIGYLATAGGDAFGPARRFRIIIEMSDPATLVASCREGLRRTGPLQLEWSATDYSHEEDLQVLFAR